MATALQSASQSVAPPRDDVPGKIGGVFRRGWLAAEVAVFQSNLTARLHVAVGSPAGATGR